MKFMILRSHGSTSSDSRRVSAVGESRQGLTLEVGDLNRKEVRDIHREEQVLGYAPPMPTKLVKPLASKDGDVAEPGPISWGVKAVGAAKSGYTGEGATVAVLDTGIDMEHAAFKKRGITITTQDFTQEPDIDTDGHGTHCAGTIFGRSVNGCRIGVAHGVTRALVGKVLGDSGGSTEAIVKGILWAYQNEAQVISMSLGMDFPGFQTELAKDYPPELATSLALSGFLDNVRLFDSLSKFISGRNPLLPGAILVAASGNESQRDVSPNYRISAGPPAAGDHFLSVAAVGRRGSSPDTQYEVAAFSNTRVRVSAPGVDIPSARVGGGLVTLSGTSMAAPHVAGVAALWAERLSKQGRPFNASEAIDWLLQSAAPLTYLNPDDTGRGLVQAP